MISCSGCPSRVSSLIFCGTGVWAACDKPSRSTEVTTAHTKRRSIVIRISPCHANHECKPERLQDLPFRTRSWSSLVQFIERPLGDRHGIENGFAEMETAQRVEPGVRCRPDDVAIPFDEDVVDGAIVAAEFRQIAALRRDEVCDLFRTI